MYSLHSPGVGLYLSSVWFNSMTIDMSPIDTSLTDRLTATVSVIFLLLQIHRIVSLKSSALQLARGALIFGSKLLAEPGL